MAAKKNTFKLLGEEVRARRQAQKWTQAFLAKKAKLSTYTVQLVEYGNRNVSVGTVEAIALAFDATLVDIFMAIERRR